MAALQKTFPCMTCGKDIKLERKPDNSGWNRYELDGVTTHKCQKSKKQQQQLPEEAKPVNNAPLDSTTQRSIMEVLQLINKKLDAILANQGVKLTK